MQQKMETGRFFRCKNLDILTYVFHRGFKPAGAPVQDQFGTRWVLFADTPELKKEIHSFLNGNKEAALLEEFRRARSFLLDSTPIKENEEENVKNQYSRNQNQVAGNSRSRA